jgi:hypothetical protein
MSSPRRVRGIFFLLALIVSATASADGERVIAEVGGGSIVFSDVRCQDRNATPEECRQREQALLRQRIAAQVVECAAEVRGLALTAEDEREIERQVSGERDDVRQMTAHHLLVLQGVLRNQEGEAIEDIMADPAMKNVAAKELETQLRYLGGAAATREALATDYLASAATATRAAMRQMLLLERIREHIAERAPPAGRTPEEEERALLESAVQRCNPRILDQQYQMPDLRGVFKRHVQQTRIH